MGEIWYQLLLYSLAPLLNAQFCTGTSHFPQGPKCTLLLGAHPKPLLSPLIPVPKGPSTLHTWQTQTDQEQA